MQLVWPPSASNCTHAGTHIHCGVEVTVLSTNKQHTHSLSNFSSVLCYVLLLVAADVCLVLNAVGGLVFRQTARVRISPSSTAESSASSVNMLLFLLELCLHVDQLDCFCLLGHKCRHYCHTETSYFLSKTMLGFLRVRKVPKHPEIYVP